MDSIELLWLPIPLLNDSFKLVDLSPPTIFVEFKGFFALFKKITVLYLWSNVVGDCIWERRQEKQKYSKDIWVTLVFGLEYCDLDLCF